MTASDSTLLQVTTEKNNVLHIAVQFKKYEVVKKIVSLCRCLAEQKNSKGNTPLHLAARVDYPQMVRSLIDHAEDLDVETGARQLAQQLLRMVNLERDTALHVVVQYGNFEVVKELIKEDPELAKYENKAGESVLFLAVDRERYDIASHILSAAPDYCSCAGRHGMNVLHALVIHTSNYIVTRDREVNRELRPLRIFGIIPEDFVREVMKKNLFTITQGDDSGWTPLHIAAQIGNEKCVKLLLEYDNSSAYVKNKEGLSVLHIAAMEGNVKVMKELITTSPYIYELLDNRGWMALHAAVESGEHEAVKFFMERPEFEVLINEQDEEGNTPIHLAAIKGHDRIVSILKKGRGLDLNAKNKDSFTIMDIFWFQKELEHIREIVYDYFKTRLRRKGARPSVMGALLKLGIRKAGDGKGMTGSNSVKEENQNNLLVDGMGMAGPNSVKKDSQNNLLVDDKGMAGPNSVKKESQNNLLVVGKGMAGPNSVKKESQTDLLVNGKGMTGTNSVKEDTQTNLLIATLIATVTFTAAFTMPGGFQSQGVDEGSAVLSKRAAFHAFLIANTLAFGLSITTILVHFLASATITDVVFHRRVVRRAPLFTNWSIVLL
uniref:PGG domain-containing protein n=1 Tax=Fagus sylvatica TaxID=28930 RepID=A0A2N9GTZ0_FAGSY